jgi:hypothetical protein
MKNNLSPPITKGISIHWEHSIEFIEIDFDDIPNNNPISNTLEWWFDIEQYAFYRTTSNSRQLNDGTFHITVKYERQKNRHLGTYLVNDLPWGESHIFINPDKITGAANWKGEDCLDNNGLVQWKTINTKLIIERTRQSASRLARNQEQFRKALLANDGVCAITKDPTIAVLEAAHIIPASKGGAEVIQNGVLLRADLHRLIDNNLISIDPKTGSIIVTDAISNRYRKLLSGKVIEPKILERIKPALAQLGEIMRCG